MTPSTAAHQASLSFDNSRSLLKLMSVESVMPSNHLILCHPLLLPSIFPSIRVFSNESSLCIRQPKYWSFSFKTILLINIHGWFSLGLTGLISLLSKELSRAFSSPTTWKHQFIGAKTMPKSLTVWITRNCGKLWKRWEYQTTWPLLEKPICRSGSNS